MDRTLNSQRLTNLLLTSFSVLALLVAAVGIYGTMSLYVGSRKTEFGIRLALGASPPVLLRSVLGEGMLLIGSGVGVGLVGALLLTRTIASLLFQVSPTDPLIFTGVAALLVSVALAACFVPARRASRVDPMTALRCE
jgi:putative ABC transport system permease protein